MKKMDTQTFKLVKDKSQNIFYVKLQKTKRPILLFSTILSMLLLFPAKKA
jgi:hypothetical protein